MGLFFGTRSKRQSAPRCWGVAGFKRFNEGRGEHEFTFELVEAGLEDLRLQ